MSVGYRDLQARVKDSIDDGMMWYQQSLFVDVGYSTLLRWFTTLVL